MKYPDDAIQAYVSSWWTTDEDKGLRRGRLIQAFVPHVSQVPLTLIPRGRSTDPSDHRRVEYLLESLQIHKKKTLPTLPTAALPEYRGEVRTVYRAKKRPVLIISIGGPNIPKRLRRDKPRWQTDPTILVAPYYGSEQGYKRAGFGEKFVNRIKKGEYPQYLWDILPLPGSPKEGSVLRFDHIQPIGRHHDSYEWTEHCLSERAMIYIDQWLHWLIEDDLPEESELNYLRKELLKLETNGGNTA